MPYKEYRELKVYDQSGYNYKSVPQIRLQGKWLEELGFAIGTSLCVKCRDGQLVITPRDEILLEE